MGKGSKADVEALPSDLAAAKSALGEAEAALNNQHYLLKHAVSFTSRVFKVERRSPHDRDDHERHALAS